MPVSKAQEAEREERRARVSQLVKARVPYRQIAKGCGVALGTIARDMKVLHTRWKNEQMVNIERQKLIDLGTIDDAIRSISGSVNSTDLAAINTLEKLIGRRSKILGYDAPVRHEMSGPGGGPITTEGTVTHDLDDLADKYGGAFARALQRGSSSAGDGGDEAGSSPALEPMDSARADSAAS